MALSKGLRKLTLTLGVDCIPLQEFKGKKLNCDSERLKLV